MKGLTEEIVAICQRTFRLADDLGTSDDLVAEGHLNSISAFILIVELETAFDIRFPEKAMTIERLRSIDKITQIVMELMRAQNVTGANSANDT